MATLFYAKISAIDYDDGTASVSLSDRENQIIRSVPFLSSVYEMPKPKDTVAVIFEEINGQIGKGVILGKIYCMDNRPSESGADIVYKEFPDGTKARYSVETSELEIDSDKFVANEIKAKKLVVDEIICDYITRRDG